MIQKGDDLQWYNELVTYMEELCILKTGIDAQIEQLIKNKLKVQNEIEKLTKKLENICESSVWKNALQKELDNVLVKGMYTYDKILESFKLLLSVLTAEIENVDKLITLTEQYSESP